MSVHCTAALLFSFVSLAFAGELPSFQKQVLPILEKRCGKCHGASKQKGDVRFDQLSADFIADRAAAETWHDALNSIQLAEMPPDGEPQLTESERRLISEWIEGKLDLALQAMQGQSKGTVIRRLNRDEYHYTMLDLLGLQMDYRQHLPPDPHSSDGFLNNGSSLGMTAMQLDGYLRTAREALALILVEGDRPDTRVIPMKAGFKLRGRKKKDGENQARLGRYHFWAGAGRGMPFDGEIKIRVKARAEKAADAPDPTMGIQYGYFVSGLTVNFLSDLDEITIDSPEPKVYEISTRAELAPRPEANVPVDKLNSVVVAYNSLEDGEKPPKPIKKPVPATDRKKKKNKSQVIYPEDPAFPKIIVDSVEVIGHDYDSWPPVGHRRILPSEDHLASRRGVNAVLSRFFRKAWRRELNQDEIDRWVDHYFEMKESGGSAIESLRETLAAGLSSANFLFLAEPAAKQTRRSLDRYELASRLSYFLWSSLPDEALLSVDLREPEVLEQQVERMLVDPKSDRFVKHFPDQWLDLAAVDRVAINPQFHRGFNDSLKADMAGESRAFFAEIFRNDLSALLFLDADFTMANARLAKHYGLSGPKSQHFERISLLGTNRTGGLPGHGAVHLAGSDGAHSHPIKRAVWLRERLLHDPPKPPPPNVPGLGEAGRDVEKMTVREQLALHREEGACADCHRFIDPWGIAFEEWDATGLKRNSIAGTNRPVDARTELPGGHEVNGLAELQRYLIEQRADQFAHALTAKLLIYALGRSLDLEDEATVKSLAESFADEGYRLRFLVQQVVASDLFRNR